MSGAATAFLLHKLWVTAVIMRERLRRKRERVKAAARVSLPRDEKPLHIVKKVPEPRPQRKKVEQLSMLDPRGKYTLPSIALLDSGEGKRISHDEEMLKTSSAILAKKLMDFGVEGRVTAVHPGPVITLYEVEPAAGVKVSQIVNLSDDLALALRG